MHDPTLEQAIKEAYASAPSDVVIMHTLEIRHPAFVDDYGNATAIRVVRDYEDFTATLEADAPLNAGEQVLFQAFAFDFKLPEVNDGGIQRIQITIDNVGRQVLEHIEQAALSTESAEVTYRPYLSTDTSQPQMNPPLTLTLTQVSATPQRITGTAEFKLLHNIAFPRDLYTLEEFPTLV